MINPRIDALALYPFQRLRALLDGISPRDGVGGEIDLALGEPKLAPPALLTRLLAEQAAGWGTYPPINGTPAFAEAAAGWLRRRFGLPSAFVHPASHIVPVSGSREGLFMAGLIAVPRIKRGVRPVALLPNPGYAVYEAAASFTGAEKVFLDARPATRFVPDFSTLDVDLLDRVSVCYLCSPGNPHGACLPRATLTQALDLARRHDFLLVVDECYSELYYDRPPVGALEAALALGPPRLDNLLVLHSLSKRSSVPGMRSGFAVGDARAIAGLARLRSYAAAGTPLPLLAAAQALWSDEAHVVETRAAYARKMAIAEEILAADWGRVTPGGGFFLWLDVGNGEAAAKTLWREAGIRSLPGAYLAHRHAGGDAEAHRYLRLALVHDDATLRRALTQVARLLTPGGRPPTPETEP